MSGVHDTGPLARRGLGRGDIWTCTLKSLAALLAGKAIIIAVALLAPGGGLEALALRWDGEHFINIAMHGYRDLGDAAFAPLYPALIRLAMNLGLNPWTAALLVANISSLITAPILCALYGFRPSLAVLLFPTMILYTTIPYSEAIAVPLMALGLLSALRGRWRLAAFTLFLAGLARYQTGVMIVALLAWSLVRGHRRPAAILAGSALALVASAVALWSIALGDPLAYIHAESLWDSSLALPFLGQSRWLLDSWFSRQPWPLPLFGASLTVKPWMWVARNIVFYIVYVVGTALLVIERRGLEALWSASIILLVASLTGVPAVSAPRLLLPAFPAIAALARKWKPGLTYIGLSAATAMWLAVWHLTSFFG